MSVAELRAELSEIGAYSHDYDDRKEGGEIQHGRPLRHRELCAVTGWLDVPARAKIGRNQRMLREALGYEPEAGPLRTAELAEALKRIRAKVDAQRSESEGAVDAA